MEHNDREYTDMLNNELKDIEPGAGLHSKVRDGIARNVVHMRRRNTALGAVVIAVILTMGLSAVTPVFGRNGTLSQVITAMTAERQAKKISKTLGKSPVEQTERALQTSEATVQTLSDSALSETDGVLALVIANKSGTLPADVLKLRATGMGWGRIMAQLNVSSRDIGKAMSQVKAVTATTGQGESSMPAVSNKNGDKVVVNGQITAFSATDITVAGKSFVIIGLTTQLKYRGKAIKPADITTKLAAGKLLYATVQGTKQADNTTLLANLIIVRDGADSEQANPSNAQANPSNAQANPSNERAAVSNEQQLRGKVTGVSANVLNVGGFANGIILNANTKVEQVGAGTVDLSAIKADQTVQVHVSLTGITYTATQVHIEDAYVKTNTTANEDQTTNSAVTTWQGTISSISVQSAVNSASEQTIGVVVLTASGQQPTVYWILATSVLQNASHHALTLAALQTLQGTAAQRVTIQGRLLANGTVDVVKIVLTTDTSTNPGKGKGKH